MQKLLDVISISTTTCLSGCLTLYYDLPCYVGANIQQFLQPLGKLQYDLEQFRLLRIDIAKNFRITGETGRKEIKISITDENITEDNYRSNKHIIKFENCLKEWLTDELGLQVV